MRILQSFDYNNYVKVSHATYGELALKFKDAASQVVSGVVPGSVFLSPLNKVLPNGLSGVDAIQLLVVFLMALLL